MILHTAYRQLQASLYDRYENGEATAIANEVFEFVLEMDRMQRLMYKDLPLTQEQEQQINHISRQLLTGKPLQYVLQRAWFMNEAFYVNESVLIPRPETEELVDLIIQQYKNDGKPMAILDIGTGSGCIPISLKKQLPFASITSVDVSKEALQVARQNADSLQADITLLHLNFLDLPQRSSLPNFDIIVSNPPYILPNEAAAMEQHVLGYEPHLALFVPEHSPVLFYDAIAAFATTHLNPGGNIFVEINALLALETVNSFTKLQFTTTLIKDMQGKDRFIVAGHL